MKELDRRGKSTLNTTEAGDGLAIDIQGAIGMETSLSLVANYISITVEGGIAILEGEVFREQEKVTAGEIATFYAGEDNVNNYLSVVYKH